jgi:DNA replication protein DnaC
VPESFRGISVRHPLFDRDLYPWRADAYRSAATALQRVPFVVLEGHAGVGKTVIAAALVHSLAERATDGEQAAARARGVRWTTAKAIGDARRESKLGTEPPLLAEAKRASFLVVDELGAETEVVDVREVLFVRHAHGRQTVITTYLDRSQIAQRYDAGGARRLLEATHAAVVEVRRPWTGDRA